MKAFTIYICTSEIRNCIQNNKLVYDCFWDYYLEHFYIQIIYKYIKDEESSIQSYSISDTKHKET